jgi:hypothetical protein
MEHQTWSYADCSRVHSPENRCSESLAEARSRRCPTSMGRWSDRDLASVHMRQSRSYADRQSRLPVQSPPLREPENREVDIPTGLRHNRVMYGESKKRFTLISVGSRLLGILGGIL